MPKVTNIHNWSVAKTRRAPLSKWGVTCSCGYTTDNSPSKAHAELTASVHTKMEVERYRQAQIKVQGIKAQASHIHTTSSSSNPFDEMTVGDLHKKLTKIAEEIKKTTTYAQDMYSEADAKLTDEDSAMSPTEYELYLEQRARASGMIAVLDAIAFGLK